MRRLLIALLLAGCVDINPCLPPGYACPPWVDLPPQKYAGVVEAQPHSMLEWALMAQACGYCSLAPDDGVLAIADLGTPLDFVEFAADPECPSWSDDPPSSFTESGWCDPQPDAPTFDAMAAMRAEMISEGILHE